MRPHIGIVMTSYMHARFIRDAVRSIVRQDGVELSVVLADNASTDGTKAIALEEFEAGGFRSQVSTVDGQGDGWSGMLREALRVIPPRVDAFTAMSGDDCLAPAALERCARLLLDPSYTVAPLCVTGMWRRVDSTLDVLGWFATTQAGRSGFYPAGDPLDALTISGRVPFMQGVYAPAVAQLAAEYLEGVDYADDIAITAALIELGAHVLHAPIHFYDYRQHSASANRTRAIEVLTDQVKVLDRLARRTGVDVAAARAALCSDLAARMGEALELRVLPSRADAFRRALPGIAHGTSHLRPALFRAFAAGATRAAIRNVRRPGGGWRLPWSAD